MTSQTLFVGGPWDGRREQVEGLPSRFYVEQLEKISQEIDAKTGAASSGPVTGNKVAYARVSWGGVNFYVALLAEEYGKYPTSVLAEALFKGYRNL